MKIKTPNPSLMGLSGPNATLLLKKSPDKPPRGMDPKLKQVLLAPGKLRKAAKIGLD